MNTQIIPAIARIIWYEGCYKHDTASWEIRWIKTISINILITSDSNDSIAISRTNCSYSSYNGIHNRGMIQQKHHPPAGGKMWHTASSSR
ncbi:hypothetical protein M8J75_008404 [Diaphorina citri]|nr:hypothetical protein M8J75_008404 [Diaphorina citri]